MVSSRHRHNGDTDGLLSDVMKNPVPCGQQQATARVRGAHTHTDSATAGTRLPPVWPPVGVGGGCQAPPAPLAMVGTRVMSSLRLRGPLDTAKVPTGAAGVDCALSSHELPRSEKERFCGGQQDRAHVGAWNKSTLLI